MAINKQAPLLVKCSEIIQETADVITIKLVSSQANFSQFKPGQFITLHCKINGVEHQRCYTIASCPAPTNELDIIVKSVPDGIVSNWLLNHLKVGDQLLANAPSGSFYLPDSNRKKLLLLSAGSGITPMLSIVRHIAKQNLQLDIVFHHSARSSDDLIRADELTQLAKLVGKSKLSYNFTRRASEKIAHCKQYSGRFSSEILSDICDDLTDRDVFVCGPVGFMSTIKALLRNAGLTKDQYFEESFTLLPLVVDSQQTDTYHIEFQYSAQKVAVKGNQTVLQAIQEAGIELDVSCTSGACGSCNSYLLKGEIHAPQAQAINSKDSARGEFLPCCSFARSDLIVDL